MDQVTEDRRSGDRRRNAAPISVAIADPSPVFRRGVASILASEGLLVAGEAATSGEAFALVESTSPDVVLVGDALPPTSGVEVIRRIKRELPRTGVILLASSEDEDLLFEATKAGAAAYLLASLEPAELIATIRRVGNGEYPINDGVLARPAVASRVLGAFRGLAQSGGSPFAPLSPREVEILDAVARGMTNRQVAFALAISEQTVKNHVSSILRKLNVNDRTQAVVYAMRRDWIHVSDDEGNRRPSGREAAARH